MREEIKKIVEKAINGKMPISKEVKLLFERLDNNVEKIVDKLLLNENKESE